MLCFFFLFYREGRKILPFTPKPLSVGEPKSTVYKNWTYLRNAGNGGLVSTNTGLLLSKLQKLEGFSHACTRAEYEHFLERT